ncbi:uncharacterized protein CG7065 [Haematobia irritans]|uniref:uncharacterized protein CG7065 n=1 Tax=Haematobia irritans TaxID=7368 RepID=UPI003F4F9FB9
MDILPGEPVPPGFEDDVVRIPRIQSTIDQYKANALIGIEYTLELHECGRPEPGYLCILCDKRADPRTIINHWTSFNHRMKYLEKHYPTAVREFQPVKYKPNSHNILIAIVQSLAEAIEDFHGRTKLKSMDADDFRHQKGRHTEAVLSGFHHDEKNGPNFLNAIDRSLIDNNKHQQGDSYHKGPPKRMGDGPPSNSKHSQKRDEFDAISSDSDNPDSAKKPKYNNKPQSFEQDDRLDVEGKKLPTPKELSLQASHIAQERYKWEKYRCMLEIHLKQMEKLQKEYEKSPEKHPQYPDEWKKFWNRRYKELQAEKKVDPNKHDYKPEWIIFWTKRMKEIFNLEVEKKKKEIKVKLGLPEEAEEHVDQIKERYKIPVNRIQRPQITDVIDISDEESPKARRVGMGRSRRTRTRSRSRSRGRSPRGRSPRGRSPRARSPRGDRRDYRRRSRSDSRSLSPFSDDLDMGKHRQIPKTHRSSDTRAYNPIDSNSEYYQYGSSRYPPAPRSGSSTHYPSHSSSGPYRVLDSSKIPKYEDSNTRDSKEDDNKEDEGPLSVVGVLRLLTALEEHLGSLGPKVVDLLGKALALEKVKANSSDDLLLNEDHCVFFETIKEKLKGLLIADVLDDHQKVRAVKKAVKNIAGVIHQVTKGNSPKDGKNETSNDTTGGSSSSIAAATQAKRKVNAKINIMDLPFDRQMVATKMAAALVLQGREDVSTEDMDKLIYFFLLMVKLSKSKRELDGKPVYCKNVLPEVGILPVVTTPLATFKMAPALNTLPGILDNDVTSSLEGIQGAENETDVEKEVSRSDANASTLESLTDSDLQTLLQNFKHLSSEEQHHLIAHLKKLESVDPERVEKLRKYVNTSDITDAGAAGPSKFAGGNDASGSSSSSKNEKRDRPPGVTDIDERSRNAVNPNKFSLDDDDDDDYNFDEVFKAASKNVNTRTPDETSRHSADARTSKSSGDSILLSSQNDLTFNPAGLKTSLSDTQNLIANLMGSLQQSNSKSKNSNSPSGPQPVPPVLPKQKQQPPAHHISGQQQKPPPPPPAQQQQQLQQQHQQQQQHQPHLQQHNMPYYDQQGGYPGMQQGGPYNQMPPNANYFNGMGGYNQNPYGPGFNQWGPGNQQVPGQNMQHFGMQNYGGYYGGN